MSTPTWTPFTGKSALKDDELDAAFQAFVTCIIGLDGDNISNYAKIGPSQLAQSRTMNSVGHMLIAVSGHYSDSVPFVLSEDSRLMGYRLRAGCVDNTKPLNVSLVLQVIGANDEPVAQLMNDNYNQEGNVLGGSYLVNFDDQTRYALNERNPVIIPANAMCRMMLLAGLNVDASCNVQWMSAELFMSPLHTKS